MGLERHKKLIFDGDERKAKAFDMNEGKADVFDQAGEIRRDETSRETFILIKNPIFSPGNLIMFIRDRSQPQYEGTARFRQLENWQGETVCSEAHLDLY